MKYMNHALLLLTIGSILLPGSLAMSSNEPSTDSGSDIDESTTEALHLVLTEVRSLRISFLEQRIDSYAERVERLLAEKHLVSAQRSKLRKELKAIDREIGEVDRQLGNPDIDGADRDYLETMREDLDWNRSGVLAENEDSLETREDALLLKAKSLEEDRLRLVAELDKLLEALDASGMQER